MSRLWNVSYHGGARGHAGLGGDLTRVFLDRRKHNTKHPKLYHVTTLEALSDKVVVVALNNWNFQSAKATAIKVLEPSMNPYLVWLSKSKGIKLDVYETAHHPVAARALAQHF